MSLGIGISHRLIPTPFSCKPNKRPVTAVAGTPPATVVNLMDVLRRSVQAGRPAAKKGKATAEKVGRQSVKRKTG